MAGKAGRTVGWLCDECAARRLIPIQKATDRMKSWRRKQRLSVRPGRNSHRAYPVLIPGNGNRRNAFALRVPGGRGFAQTRPQLDGHGEARDKALPLTAGSISRSQVLRVRSSFDFGRISVLVWLTSMKCIMTNGYRANAITNEPLCIAQKTPTALTVCGNGAACRWYCLSPVSAAGATLQWQGCIACEYWGRAERVPATSCHWWTPIACCPRPGKRAR